MHLFDVLSPAAKNLRGQHAAFLARSMTDAKFSGNKALINANDCVFLMIGPAHSSCPRRRTPRRPYCGRRRRGSDGRSPLTERQSGRAIYGERLPEGHLRAGAGSLRRAGAIWLAVGFRPDPAHAKRAGSRVAKPAPNKLVGLESLEEVVSSLFSSIGQQIRLKGRIQTHGALNRGSGFFGMVSTS